MRLFYLILIGFAMQAVAQDVCAPRKWASADKRTITATLLEIDAEKRTVTLERDGKIKRTVFWKSLAEQDIAWLEKRVHRYPPFAWDRVPLYAHFGIGEGLKSEQYDFLAEHFYFITLTAGRLSRSSKGSAELYTAKAARAIKKRNPHAKVLYYWASDKPKHQSRISNEAYPGDCLIHTQRRMDDKVQTIQYIDVTRQEVRDWWSDTAAAAVHEYSCDGIFVDGATAGRPDGTWNRACGRQNAEAMDQAVFAMLKDAREKMGPDKLIIFNPLHGTDGERPALGQEYLPVTDGAMVDDFDRGGELRVQSKEYMASTIETMQKAAREGNVIIFKAWPGFALKLRKDLQVRMDMDPETIRRAAREDLTFPLACFLVGAEANCFFAIRGGENLRRARSSGIRSLINV